MAGVTKLDGLGWKNGSRFVAKWVLTDADPNGDWLVLQDAGDKSVHVHYAAGTGTVTIQGSNETGTPTNAVTLRDEARNNLAFASPGGIEIVLANTAQIRPVLTGGSGATINVYLCVNGS